MGMQNCFRELRATLLLAAPITAGHVSQMLLGVADTVMIGRVGVVELAAAALTNTLVHFVFIVGIGLLSSVSVLVSHAYGAGDRLEAAEVLRRGMALALGSGLLICASLWGSLPLLGLLGQPDDVVAATGPYLGLIALTMPAMMTIVCLRNYSEAQNTPWPAFWSGIAAVFLNIFLNWVLIYGNLGAPALGLVGAGIATLLARLFNVAVLYWWLRYDPRFHDTWPMRWLAPIPWRHVSTMLKLGFPVGLQLLMEVGAFSVTTLFMGWIGIAQMAAHQIAITCAGTTFMFPLGISLAVAIRVGHVIGAGEPHRARSVGYGALGFAILLSAVFTTGFILFSTPLAGLFTLDQATLLLASKLIVVAGFFQLFDGTQVVAAGALRGCKDVRIPAWIIFAAYWILAIPAGCLLAFQMDAGAVGLWVGLAGGLAFAAIGLTLRFHRQTAGL